MTDDTAAAFEWLEKYIHLLEPFPRGGPVDGLQYTLFQYTRWVPTGERCRVQDHGYRLPMFCIKENQEVLHPATAFNWRPSEEGDGDTHGRG